MKIVKLVKASWVIIAVIFCSNSYAARTLCSATNNDLRSNEVVIDIYTDWQNCAGPYGTGSGTSYLIEYIDKVPANGLGEKVVCGGYRLPNGYTVKKRSGASVCKGQQFEHLVLNAAPVPNGFNFTTPKNTVLTAIANTTDDNNDPLTYFLGGTAENPVLAGKSQFNGNIVLNKLTGEFTYTPATNVEAQDFFTIYVSDGKSDPYGMPVFIVIGNPVPGNQAPQFVIFPVDIEQDVEGGFMPQATDAENNPLVITVNTSKPPLYGTLKQYIVEQGRLILMYTPNKGFTGVDHVYVKVTDGYHTVDGVYPITVTFRDADADGMANWWENKNQLNYIDPSDALLDHDADQLNNLEEYKAGTSILLADTDSDGVPDGYEVINNRFNPLVFDSQEDFDGDGYTNYEEFMAKTNPNIKADNPRLPLAAWLIPVLHVIR